MKTLFGREDRQDSRYFCFMVWVDGGAALDFDQWRMEMAILAPSSYSPERTFTFATRYDTIKVEKLES